MKTFIFSESALDEALKAWVGDAVATQHPKAMRNAQLVANEMKGILLQNKKLYKDTDQKPITQKLTDNNLSAPSRVNVTKEPVSGNSFTVEEMKELWESGEG